MSQWNSLIRQLQQTDLGVLADETIFGRLTALQNFKPRIEGSADPSEIQDFETEIDRVSAEQAFRLHRRELQKKA